MNKSALRIEAERLCRQFPDAATRTLAKRLSDSHKSTVEQARTVLRDVRGNNGASSRARCDPSLQRENQPAGWKPAIPPSLAKPWKPYSIGNDVTVAILSDTHIPYHSKTALHAAVTNCLRREPDVLLINGDFLDFYSISRHQKDPSKRDLKKEMKLGRDGFAYLRDQFGSGCQIVYKLGNHEERWQHYLWNSAPEISDDPRMRIDQWIDAEKYGIEVVAEQRPVMVGKLPVMHGHELGKAGVAVPVNPARGVFMRTLSSMLVGHSHRTSQHAEPDWQQELTTCWSTGCLCDMRPEYARINKWNWGAAIVEVDSRGEHHVDNFRIGPHGEVW